MFRFDLGTLRQGHTRIAKLKVLITRLLLVLEFWDVWESSDSIRFDIGPLLQGQTRVAKLKSAYNLLIIGTRGLHCDTNL